MINPFWIGSELLFDIVAILEYTKRTESGMQTFSQITTTQNQEEKPDPHEPKVILLNKPYKNNSSGKVNLRNLL